MELDRTSFPALRERIAASDASGALAAPRSYPGYPRVDLGPRPRARLGGLGAALRARRCARALEPALPSRRELSRLLDLAHGLTGNHGRGPVPSAGGLQALELYLVALEPGAWLAPGAYHYDRAGHHLSRVVDGAARAGWAERLPSLEQVEGGALLWVLAGDHPRVEARYGDRAERFLLLEAGHLMQDLCLVSAALGLSTVPLGGVFEREVARALVLPRGDLVLYAGVCGRPAGTKPGLLGRLLG